MNSFLLCISQTPNPLHFCGCTSDLNFINFLLVSIAFYFQVVENSTKNYDGQTSKALDLEFGLDVDSYAVKHCRRSHVPHSIRPVFSKPLIIAET